MSDDEYELEERLLVERFNAKAAEANRDPRSTHELITLALSEQDDSSNRRKAIEILRARGTREGFEAARSLCASLCVEERKLGVEILSMFGTLERAYPDETLDLLSRMLETESEPSVLEAIAAALGFLRQPEALPALLSLKQHPDENVRYEVAFALGMYPDDSRAIRPLIELSADSDVPVRNQATWILGVLVLEDTLEIRTALLRRLDDSYLGTCAYALAGLAARKDSRIISKLRAIFRDSDLEPGNLWTILKATSDLGDPAIVPDLNGFRDRCREIEPEFSDWLDAIIQVLSADR